MSKLTQGHIDTLVNWMMKNPGKKLNVSSTWRNSGYEVIQGYQTMAINKVYKALKEQGYEVDTKNRCLVSKRKQDEYSITKKPNEVLKTKTTIVLDKKGTPKSGIVEYSAEPKPEKLTYATDLKPESVQNIAKSLQGMAYTAQLMGKGATVTVRVEMGV